MTCKNMYILTNNTSNSSNCDADYIICDPKISNTNIIKIAKILELKKTESFMK